MKKLITIVLLGCALCVQAQEWHTMFAYNNVTQIAMSEDDVYAISDGSMFSVRKNTEQLKIYEELHSTGISCIYYDQRTQQLLIAYKNGKIDMLSDKGVQYVGDLYDKDMVQQKTIYNVTVVGNTAYLSTHYGVQTFDIRTHKFVDSYWLRPDGQEAPIQDVLIANDSIYAFTADSMFCAALTDNLVDYTYWKRERYGRVTPDEDKGKHYQDATSHWYAGGAEGIVRFTATERLTYKPLGPLNNTPYSVTTVGTKLYVVSGGRWAAQYERPGVVMLYEDGTWTNITQQEIIDSVGRPVLDFMNVAVDPRDDTHFFVTSYGTGLYEFKENQVVNKFIAAEDNTISSAVPSNPAAYTRIDGATYDADGNLWFLNTENAQYQLVILDHLNNWRGLPLIVGNQKEPLYTPAGLILDNHHPNYKWVGAARAGTGLILLDDGNTPFDASDDKAIKRSEWMTPSGHHLAINEIRAMIQDLNGRIWLGTDQGIVIVDTVDYFTSDACLRPDLMDENGENPLESLKVTALCLDTGGRIWAGTETMGVYVLNDNATEIIAHYTTDNSPMLSNNILSLSCDVAEHVYVGTAEGLLSWKDNGSTGNHSQNESDEKELGMGAMQQWRLHFSYSDPHEVAASPSYIYVAASGALYAVDRKTNEIIYWDKSNGLTGSTISHIAYDSSSKRLVIAYEDGRIDLLTDDGKVITMPDLYMKASSIATSINAISVGKKATYLSLSFGVVAINTAKAEVIDTYYIGTDASAVDVKQVVESGDSLYAFTEDKWYRAALKNNLLDYSFWQESYLPATGLTHAVAFNEHLYILIDGTLYRLYSGNWIPVVPNTLAWIRVSGGQLLTYELGNGFLRLTEEEQLTGLTGSYVAVDAVYSQGEYWLAQENAGLVHLSSAGDEVFVTTGPNSNFAYRLCAAHGQIYSVIGGRWADHFARLTKINIYDGNNWRKIAWEDIMPTLGDTRDPVSVAVDPQDPGHFFVATYGTGVLEFKDYAAVKRYGVNNSTLREAADPANYYTRTDGAVMDAEGNLWVMNATSSGYPLHVMTPDGQWRGIPLRSSGQNIFFTTPTGIHMDYRNLNHKWMIEQRGESGVILFDDKGTPTNTSDDRCVKRSSWIDQNGREIKPEFVLCLTQDLNNRIWIGTQAGILTIPSSVDFFTSNACRRIIIPRNDGTGLGDYLLGDERINCMAVDGGNRMWIGTENSGLYLIEDDTITVAHFTENNSLLPSNTIQSIVIHPTTGEVFVGTGKGLASYRSDASEAQPNMSAAYAFPNPVRPNYGGMISIAGLMENTVVNIIDAGGNLVCKTRSHGGMAVWDGKLPDGRRATAGVYTALCNAEGGHTVVKILVIR